MPLTDLYRPLLAAAKMQEAIGAVEELEDFESFLWYFSGESIDPSGLRAATEEKVRAYKEEIEADANP